MQLVQKRRESQREGSLKTPSSRKHKWQRARQGSAQLVCERAPLQRQPERTTGAGRSLPRRMLSVHRQQSLPALTRIADGHHLFVRSPAERGNLGETRVNQRKGTGAWWRPEAHALQRHNVVPIAVASSGGRGSADGPKRRRPSPRSEPSKPDCRRGLGARSRYSCSSPGRWTTVLRHNAGVG